MQEFVLGNGIKIPAVGYGSYLSTEKEGKSVIKDALDAGYRYIDMAFPEKSFLYAARSGRLCFQRMALGSRLNHLSEI